MGIGELYLIDISMFTTQTKSSFATNFAEDKLNSFHDVPATRYTCHQVMTSTVGLIFIVEVDLYSP